MYDKLILINQRRFEGGMNLAKTFMNSVEAAVIVASCLDAKKNQATLLLEII